MTSYAEYKPTEWNVVELLKTELASYPGRTALVGRIALACTSVIVLAEVFRIPGAVLGASFPILISRESPEATRKSALQIALGSAIGSATVILGGVLTAGSPFLHILWVFAILLAAFYAMSSLNFISPALTASAVIALGIQEWDYPISAELRVEHTLYTLLSIVIGCLISALIETVLAKKKSPNTVLDEIDRRLVLVQELLSSAQAEEFPPSALTIQLRRSTAKGVEYLLELLMHARYEPNVHHLLTTLIALVRQLIDLCSVLVEFPDGLTIKDQERCLALAHNLSSIRSRLSDKEMAGWVDLPLASNIANPILAEIERTVNLIAQSFSDETAPIHQFPPGAAPQPALGPFVVGLHRNNEHLKFAVRGAIPTLLCYFFHLSIGWPGLAASILTCALTARRFTGASRQRQGLRFMGFFVGAGVIGWGTEVIVLPHLDNLAEFTLLFASVMWIGSWVATSGPRISFSGFQLVIAYNLVSLNRFTLNTSLVPSRDTVLSVLLGVVAMWLVFDHLWAEDSNSYARNLLLATLRSLADLKIAATGSPQEVNQRLAATSFGLNREIDKLHDVADLYTFESFPKKSYERLVNRSIRTLNPHLRAYLFVKTGLLHHRILTAAEPTALIQEVDEQTSIVLLGLATAIETESMEALCFSNRNAELRSRILIEEEKSNERDDRQAYIEMRLSESLISLMGHLERRARLNFPLETQPEGIFGN